MKKILIGILIILLVVMAYSVIADGFSVGNLKVLGVQQIKEENENLEKAISDAALNIASYYTEVEELETCIDNLLEAKEEYKNLVNVSTESEIAEAMTRETYKIEYLWTRIGSHATSEGVTLKLDITTGDTGSLNFTITGTYIAIINFVSAIEDDSELGFRIENFKIVGGADSAARQATFVVYNVSIESELATSTTDAATTTEE